VPPAQYAKSTKVFKKQYKSNSLFLPPVPPAQYADARRFFKKYCLTGVPADSSWFFVTFVVKRGSCFYIVSILRTRAVVLSKKGIAASAAQTMNLVRAPSGALCSSRRAPCTSRRNLRTIRRNLRRP